jgi:hypothetical protein
MAQYSLPKVSYSLSSPDTVIPNYQAAQQQILGNSRSAPGALGAFSNKQEDDERSYNLPSYGSIYDSSSGVDESAPFMNYRETGGRMTDWGSAGSRNSQIIGEQGLAYDNLKSRQTLQENAVPQQNQALQQWVYSTQTLSNPSFGTFSCTSDADCIQFNTGSGEKYTCNPNYAPWSDAKGNQTGAVCSRTIYPELHWQEPSESGNGPLVYHRKSASEGGVGARCNTDNQCADGYLCNNSTDFNGSNQQQTGYCAQPYTCPDKQQRFLGTPYNSSIPIPPDPEQNSNGYNSNGKPRGKDAGYETQADCMNNSSASQSCVYQNNGWFAVYPGYCPLPTTQRKGGNPQGAMRQFSATDIDTGFKITSGICPPTLCGKSNDGSKSALGQLSMKVAGKGENEPFQYLQSLNGVSKSQQERQGMLFGR